MTDIFLAYGTGSRAAPTYRLWDWEKKPFPLLVSFYYINHWRRYGERLCAPRKTILDSGAFSAWNAGKEIDIHALTEEAKNPRWDEVVALDVIHDAEKTWENTRWMNANGASRAYPVFHIGEPWEYLHRYCAAFPKVGLSCRFGEPLSESIRWVEQCFARTWPHRFHSFGWVSKRVLFEFPFDSADCSSWCSPSMFRTWKSFGGRRTYGLEQNKVIMCGEIEIYWDLMMRLKQKWGKELERWGVGTI